MKRFWSDMKIMYQIRGRKILKEFLILDAFLLLFMFGIFRALEMSFMERLFPIILVNVGFIITYMVLFFGQFRPFFKELRKEKRLKDKYKLLLENFMKTY